MPRMSILQQLDGRGELFLLDCLSLSRYPRVELVLRWGVGLVRFEIGGCDEMVAVLMRRFVLDDIGKRSGW